ncbi:MAG: GDP-mannose 4,6-dehydratase [Candidatus Dormibacteraeota bacterium]|nr:GDP-mannose 4,6-dehydratase [Candidatus Dormibacteraeota bacterium]
MSNNWSERTALVTGVGGFVGSGMALELIKRRARVVGIVRDSGGLRALAMRGLTDRIDIVQGSINHPGLVARAINEYEVDTVFHLAAQAIVGVAQRSPLSTFESNITGTWHVLEACRTSTGVARVVVASSDKAYGDQSVLPYTEDTALEGIYPYDASKVCADVLARSYAAAYHLPVAVVRCANIYGPGDLNWSRLIPGTIRSALAGEDPVVRSDGTPERDYIYLEDAVDGYLRTADALPKCAGEAFNFGSAQSVSALALVKMILAATETPHLRPRVLGRASGEIDRQCLSADKARRLLEWKPRTTLAAGLTKSVPWYRDHLGTVRARTLQEAFA